jgi:hypothetical protein
MPLLLGVRHAEGFVLSATLDKNALSIDNRSGLYCAQYFCILWLHVLALC